jgi:hypothetical protein
MFLPQVAADGEGPLAGAGQDDDTDGGADRDVLDGPRQPGTHLGRDRIVGTRSVEGDDRDPVAGEVVNQDG